MRRRMSARLASRLTRITRCHSSRRRLDARLAPKIPAFSTSMSSPPNAWTARRAHARPAGSVTSHATPRKSARPGAARRCRIEVEPDDGRAALQERLDARLADARGGAGDQRHLAREHGRAAAAGAWPAPDPSTRRRKCPTRAAPGSARQRVGAQDDVDRVRVDVAGDDASCAVRPTCTARAPDRARRAAPDRASQLLLRVARRVALEIRRYSSRTRDVRPSSGTRLVRST